MFKKVETREFVCVEGAGSVAGMGKNIFLQGKSLQNHLDIRHLLKTPIFAYIFFKYYCIQKFSPNLGLPIVSN